MAEVLFGAGQEGEAKTLKHTEARGRRLGRRTSDEGLWLGPFGMLVRGSLENDGFAERHECRCGGCAGTSKAAA